MTKQSSDISVIVPVFNGEKFIKHAVENILAQSYSPAEVIIIDDGSTDKTAEIVKVFRNRVCYVSQKNRGPAAARNHGLRLATGDLIAFLDVDDLWPLNRLERDICFLEKNPNVKIVQGLIQQMSLKKSELPTSNLKFKISSEPYQFINIGSATFRRTVFEIVGNFDETLFDNEDTDWFIRAWEKNITKKVINEVSLYYRLHDQNMIWSQKPAQFALIKVFKKHLDRNRSNKATVKLNMVSLKEYIGKPYALT